MTGQSITDAPAADPRPWDQTWTEHGFDPAEWVVFPGMETGAYSKKDLHGHRCSCGQSLFCLMIVPRHCRRCRIEVAEGQPCPQCDADPEAQPERFAHRDNFLRCVDCLPPMRIAIVIGYVDCVLRKYALVDPRRPAP